MYERKIVARILSLLAPSISVRCLSAWSTTEPAAKQTQTFLGLFYVLLFENIKKNIENNSTYYIA